MIKKIVSYLFLIFGVFSFVLETIDAFSPAGFSFTDFAYSLGFIAWGVGGLNYVEYKYLGGAPTIVGAVLVTVAIWMLVYVIERYFVFLGTKFYLGLFTSFLFLTGGVVLLRSGHIWHIERKRLDSNIDQRNRRDATL